MDLVKIKNLLHHRKHYVVEYEFQRIENQLINEIESEIAEMEANEISSNAMLADSLPLHKCQYCGVMTKQSDDECYKKP